MVVCLICKKEKIITSWLGVCKECILNRWDEVKPLVWEAHQKVWDELGVKVATPEWVSDFDESCVAHDRRLTCNVCANRCKIPPDHYGLCGLRKNEHGRLVSVVDARSALLEYYYDPLPTNCVASYWCGESNLSFYNLAVFMGACSFNCLFCQNWHFREVLRAGAPCVDVEKLLSAVHERVRCICFFGGDPSCQAPFVLNFSRQLMESSERAIRICVETNGNWNAGLIDKMAEVVASTRGLLKFDLKFWDEKLNIAICGVPNKATLENFEKIGKKDSSILVASTLLVPGYADAEEVRRIAEFIASIDENIPYALLAFHPCFKMSDLPYTSKKLALECMKAAEKAGLKNVRIGNEHLLV